MNQDQQNPNQNPEVSEQLELISRALADEVSSETLEIMLTNMVDIWKRMYRRKVDGCEQTIDDLQKALETLKQQTNGLTAPDYGSLPVTPEVYEAVLTVARDRNIAPGVLMTSEKVSEHLMMLIHREII